MEASSGLHVYIVGISHDDEWWEEAVVVSAESPEHAVRLAHPGLIAGDPDWVRGVLDGETDYSVERYPAADSLATEPKVIDESLLRPFGWHYDGEHECQGCGEWLEGVCLECDLCPECKDGECEGCQKP